MAKLTAGDGAVSDNIGYSVRCRLTAAPWPSAPPQQRRPRRQLGQRLIARPPAWRKTLTARTAATPKVHVVDSGVAARLVRLSTDKLLRRDATALTELGHLLETFVVGRAHPAGVVDGRPGWPRPLADP